MVQVLWQACTSSQILKNHVASKQINDFSLLASLNYSKVLKYFTGMVVHTSVPLETPTALRHLETTNMRQGDICNFEIDSKLVVRSGLVSQQLAVRTVLPPAHPVELLASHQER